MRHRKDGSRKRRSKVTGLPLKALKTVDIRDLEIAKLGGPMRDFINSKKTGNNAMGCNRTGMPEKQGVMSGGSLGTNFNMSTTRNTWLTLTEVSIKIIAMKLGSLELNVKAKKRINGKRGSTNKGRW